LSEYQLINHDNRTHSHNPKQSMPDAFLSGEIHVRDSSTGSEAETATLGMRDSLTQNLHNALSQHSSI